VLIQNIRWLDGVVCGVELEKLIAEVHVCEKHAAAAVARHTKRVKHLSLCVCLVLCQRQIGAVLVTNDIATCKAADGNDHPFTWLLFFLLLRTTILSFFFPHASILEIECWTRIFKVNQNEKEKNRV
jgi:hypothetical protein